MHFAFSLCLHQTCFSDALQIICMFLKEGRSRTQSRTFSWPLCLSKSFILPGGSKIGERSSEASFALFLQGHVLCDQPWSYGHGAVAPLCCFCVLPGQFPFHLSKTDPLVLLPFPQGFLASLVHGETELRQWYSLSLNIIFLIKWRS